MAFAPGTKVGPYKILELLGAGGMGEVYQARDTRLLRTIALKCLALDAAAPADRDRFLHEAQAASRLNHPNIVAIYDVLEQDGLCFIAMEYVSGKTLETLIPASGLPIEEALTYAHEIAEALIAAHAGGIVHRDLKPANIIIRDDNRVKLLDFGVAKRIEAAPPAHETATLRTMPGMVIGTASYMSPEQAQGREVDVRSDIFSFGLVLYEMLCGRRAFQAESWIATMAAILHQQPQPLRNLNSSLPPWIDQIVDRCLRKSPSDRFSAMTEIRNALASKTTGDAARPESPSIAVLSFANLSDDKENEYFSDGLAEEIINALARIPGLRVIARTSAFAFRGSPQSLRSIGQKLSVTTILEGSVRRAANRVRVTAQLVRVSDESHLWSERYDRELTDIFAIQDDISQAIAAALQVRLARQADRPVNIEAFQNYLKGLYWYQNYTPESLAKAKHAFEQALSLDPAYAAAFAGLAVFHFGIGAISILPMTDRAPLAKSAAQKALELDPQSSEANSVMGLVTGAVEFDWKTSQRYFEQALSIVPVPPLVRVRYALYFLTPLRRFEEAAEQYRRAYETDPLSMMVHFGLAFTLYCQRRYAEAIEHAARAVELHPEHWLEHFAMGLALSQTGDFEGAAASLRRTVELSPGFTMAQAFLAAAYARSGASEHSESILSAVRERSRKHYVSPVCFAIYEASVGEADRMFVSLEAAHRQRDPYLTRMASEPYFDPYHGDARFQSLLGRMNLG